MRLTTDLDGNTSFGDEMIRRGDGQPTHCRACDKPLGPIEAKLGAELCGECVEKQPAKPRKAGLRGRDSLSCE